MRTRSVAAFAAAAVLLSAAPALATLQVRKLGGAPVSSDEATVEYDAETGAWTITLSALYAPGGETLYEVHGDGGETIDRLVIDVPCWQDPDCVPAGSPVIVRVLSDSPDGIRTVHEIEQTGNAETILANVDVTEDIGRVEVETIGIMRAGRDIVGPVRATTAGNPSRGISQMWAERDILGDIEAEEGKVVLVVADGRLGTPAKPVVIRGKYRDMAVIGYGGIWADIKTDVNGGDGYLHSIAGLSFTGTIDTPRISSRWSPEYAAVSIWERFEGSIIIGGSFSEADQWMQFPLSPAAIGGQIIINADATTGGSWESPVHVGFPDDPGGFDLHAGYAQTPDTLGGGSIGIVPFALHDEASVPANGEIVTSLPDAVRLRHYGPIDLDGPEPLVIARRAAGSQGAYDVMPSSSFETVIDAADTNTLVVTGVSGSIGFESGYDYRLTATSDLVCAVGPRPPVAWSGPFTIRLEAGSSCIADLDGDGDVDVVDLLVLVGSWGPCGGCAGDLDGNGVVDFEDLLALFKNWGPC